MGWKTVLIACIVVICSCSSVTVFQRSCASFQPKERWLCCSSRVLLSVVTCSLAKQLLAGFMSAVSLFRSHGSMSCGHGHQNYVVWREHLWLAEVSAKHKTWGCLCSEKSQKPIFFVLMCPDSIACLCFIFFFRLSWYCCVIPRHRALCPACFRHNA